MTTITVQTPRTVATPRGAVLGAWLFQIAIRGVQRLARMRSDHVQQQALAGRIGDAASVRRYAQSVMQYDPRFASDLFAAADRHERFEK